MIGVSIALPDECGEELQEYRVELGDEQARGIPSHITLAPPIRVSSRSYDDVVGHLQEAASRHASYKVHLRGTGTFRPVSPVVFIGVVEGISECELLAADVCDVLVEGEAEFPYHPHVTIAQDLPEETLDQAFTQMADFDCVFEVDSFWLYVHDSDEGWLKAEQFQLA